MSPDFFCRSYNYDKIHHRGNESGLLQLLLMYMLTLFNNMWDEPGYREDTYYVTHGSHTDHLPPLQRLHQYNMLCFTSTAMFC